MVKTELVKYPCPKCGIYYEPEFHMNGYAFMECIEVLIIILLVRRRLKIF